MNFLQAIWRVVLYIGTMLRSEIGLFDTSGGPTDNPQIVVPNPKTIAGSGSGGKYIGVPVYEYVFGQMGGGDKVTGSSPTDAANAVAFYYGFSTYMPLVTPLTDPLRFIVALIAKWLYWLDIALQVMYVNLFNIMNIGGDQTYFQGSNYQVASGGMNLTDWFHDGQVVGTVLCIIMFMCYIIATMIAPSSKTWPRMKTAVYCLFLGTGVVCALPVLISFATYGASSVAQSALGNGQQSTSTSSSNADNNNGMQINSLANEFFYNHVYSVPHKIFTYGTQQNDPLYDTGDDNANSTSSQVQGIEDQPNSELYSNDDGHNSSIGSTPGDGQRSIEIPLKIINLDAMSASDRYTWNGLGPTSITPFLDKYGGEDDVLDKTTLGDLAKAHNEQVKQQAGQKAEQQYINKAGDNYLATHTVKNGHIVHQGSIDSIEKQPRQEKGNSDRAQGFNWLKDGLGHVKNGLSGVLGYKDLNKAKNHGKVVQIAQSNNSGKTVHIYKPKNNSSVQYATVKAPNTKSQLLVHKGQLPQPKNDARAIGMGNTVQQEEDNPNRKANKSADWDTEHGALHPNADEKKSMKKNTSGLSPSAKKKLNKAKDARENQVKNDGQANSAKNDAKSDTQANPLQDIFEFHLTQIGPHATIQQLRDFGSGGSITAPINHSFAMYKVDWSDIYLGLIVLLIVMVAFIFKLLDAFFEAAVMYAVMDIMVARDMNDPRKMKQWFRNFFNLWAMLIIDVIIIRIFFIAYFTVNTAVEQIFLQYMPVQIGGNTTVMGIIQAIADIGLMVKCLEGNQAINEALGRPTGARNGWAHALAFMGGVRALGMGGRALGHGIGRLGLAGKGATNMMARGGRHLKNGHLAHGLKKAKKAFSDTMGVKGGKSMTPNGSKTQANGVFHRHNNDEPNKKSLNPQNTSHTTEPKQTDNTDTSENESQPTSTPTDDDSESEDSGGQTLIGGNNDANNVGDNHAGSGNANAKAKNKEPSQQGEHFAHKQLSNKRKDNMAKAKNMAHQQAKFQQTPKDVGQAITPQTANERSTAQARELRSKKHPVQAGADKFFNGVTHVGNGIAEAAGGQGLNVDHDKDAAFNDPGYGDNPNELQSEGTTEDSDEDINDLFNDNSSLSDLSQKLEHTQQQVNTQATTSTTQQTTPSSVTREPSQAADEPMKSALDSMRSTSSSSNH